MFHTLLNDTWGVAKALGLVPYTSLIVMNLSLLHDFLIQFSIVQGQHILFLLTHGIFRVYGTGLNTFHSVIFHFDYHSRQYLFALNVFII